MTYCKIIVVFVFVLTASLPYANSKVESKIVESYKKSKDKIVLAAERERKILRTLYAINSRMKEMSKKRDRLTNRFLNVRSTVKDLAQDIVSLEADLDLQKKRLSKRIKLIYKMGESGSLPLLFSSLSSHDLDIMMKYLRLLSERDQKIISDYQSTLDNLIAKRDNMKRQVKKLVVLRDELKGQEAQLESQQHSKNKILGEIKVETKFELKKLAKLRSKTEDFGSDVLDVSFFEKKGRVQWPVEGELIQPYGLVQGVLNGIKIRHKGYFIATPKNKEVIGVHAGQVAYVGPLTGHGQTIVINHGDHFYTVYSHLGTVEVKRGDIVKEGKKIGETGTPSPLFGVGVYFEIRHFSDAIDPKNWLKSEDDERRSST